MAKTDNLSDYLAEIAKAIRNKKGTTEPINAQDFASEIESIEGGETIIQEVPYVYDDATKTLTIESESSDENKVNAVKINDEPTWMNPAILNYVGMDASGNFEGSSAYDGMTVAYAIGDVGFTTSTDDEGNEVETVGYSEGGGYNDDYFPGVSFFISEFIGEDRPPEQVIPSDLIIPSTHNEKPVLKILDNAFKGSVVSSNHYVYGQCGNIETITIPEGVEELGQYSCGIGSRAKRISLPESLKRVLEGCFFMCNTDVILPENVEYLGGGIKVSFNEAGGAYKAGKCIYYCKNASMTKSGNGSYGSLDCFKTIIFKNTVESLTGPLFYSSVPSTLVFEHSSDAEITLNISSLKGATEITIYTDNTMVREYDWAGANITATFLPLSDYIEE